MKCSDIRRRTRTDSSLKLTSLTARHDECFEGISGRLFHPDLDLVCALSHLHLSQQAVHQWEVDQEIRFGVGVVGVGVEHISHDFLDR